MPGIDNSYPNARLQISALYEQTGQHALARKHAEHVVKNDPGNAEALGRIARTHLLNDNIDMAMDLYRQLLKSNPDAFHAAAVLADLQ